MHRNARVLILDDDEDDIFLVEDAIGDIAEAEYKVVSTTSPAKAASFLDKGEVDIVLCDHFMGSTTGTEFIAQQRQNGIETPIILLTGMSDRSTDNAALRAGASDFISKINLTPDVLDRSIRYALANARRQQVLQKVLENVNAGVALISPDLTPTIWNPEFEHLAQYAADCSDSADVAVFAKRVLTEKRIVQLKRKIIEKRVSYTSDNGMVLLLHDVTEHVEALRELEAAQSRANNLAMNCSLTALPNRNSFAERIQAEIDKAEQDGTGFYLLNLDLNKFKEVNDVYGHTIGDNLLKEVADRFREVCREGEYLARLGGDEFIAIQPNPDNSNSEIPSLSERLTAAVEDTVIIDGIHLDLGVSIGIAQYPKHGLTVEELLSNADIAMYRAKRDVTSRVHAFNEEMDRKIRETRVLGQELTKAVDRGEIDVHFQPQLDIATGKITGFEALARWNHPQLGFVSPSMFIPLAEERGLISRLGLLVLHKSCEIAASWPIPLKVAVNVSPVQIRDTDLIERVHEALLNSGLSPNRLELEVTESVLIDDKVRALHVLRGLKNLGVSIALDDFGTGFSSLSTLIAFPFDKIKIDRSFIENCGTSNQAALVTRTIIKMGVQLGCRMIAEGVQSLEHVEFLKNEGCHVLQGYLIGRPTPNEGLKPYFHPTGIDLGAPANPALEEDKAQAFGG